jgi:signal transduction histidine kinase
LGARLSTLRRTWRLEMVIQAIVGAAFVAGGLIAVLLVYRHERAQALREAEEKGRLILAHNLATHEYFTRELKPAVFALSEGILSSPRYDPSWMSSTYAIRRIGRYREEAKNDGEPSYYYKEAAIDARDPRNEADGIERAFLVAARSRMELLEEVAVRDLDGKPHLVVMRRGETMGASCIRCHSTPAAAPAGLVERYGSERGFGRREGELASAVSVRIPLAVAFASVDAMARKLSIGIVAMLVLVYAAQVVLLRRLLFRPLGSIRSAAEAIARDESLVGRTVPMPGGRELGDLTTAFNAMSVELGRERTELERKVELRTRELVETHRLLESEMRGRMETDARLRQAEKMDALGRLAGGVAHDFNNLLTVINASSEFVMADLSTTDPRWTDVQEIHAAGHRAASLTRQLLAFSRQEAGEVQVVDLGGLLERLSRLLRRLLREDVELRVERPAEPAPVLADATHLEQIILNLAVNARDAMPGGGSLQMTVGEEVAAADADDAPPGSRWVVLTVRDTGTGMDEETLARAFDPFFTTKGPGAGSGLGLATVHGLVHGAGGRIRVESAPGRGSTFHVAFPRAEDDKGAARGGPDRPLAEPPGRASGTILLVEDEPSVREVARRILASRGYDVHEARDGEEALRVVEGTARSIDLVVTDIVMPHMSGAALAARLHAERPGLPVVFVSGYTADVLTGDLPGRLLRKPYSPVELVCAVAEALGGRCSRPEAPGPRSGVGDDGSARTAP